MFLHQELARFESVDGDLPAGMGIERITMLLYQINDLRLFSENDIRFLRQFTPSP